MGIVLCGNQGVVHVFIHVFICLFVGVQGFGIAGESF